MSSALFLPKTGCALPLAAGPAWAPHAALAEVSMQGPAWALLQLFGSSTLMHQPVLAWPQAYCLSCCLRFFIFLVRVPPQPRP